MTRTSEPERASQASQPLTQAKSGQPGCKGGPCTKHQVRLQIIGVVILTCNILQPAGQRLSLLGSEETGASVPKNPNSLPVRFFKSLTSQNPIPRPVQERSLKGRQMTEKSKTACFLLGVLRFTYRASAVYPVFFSGGLEDMGFCEGHQRSLKKHVLTVHLGCSMNRFAIISFMVIYITNASNDTRVLFLLCELVWQEEKLHRGRICKMGLCLLT